MKKLLLTTAPAGKPHPRDLYQQLTLMKLLLLLFIAAGLGACNKTTEAVPPQLTTRVVTIDAVSGAVYTGGQITAGEDYITADGICWSSTNNLPTISDSVVLATVSVNTFEAALTGLTPGKTYYLRAFANGYATGYGQVLQVTIPQNMANTYGRVSTLAGSTEGFVDGNAATTLFNYPMGIFINTAGNLLIADGLNNAIRVTDTEGNTTTLAGNTSAGFYDGLATAARFTTVAGVVSDAAGNIYVADRDNNRIRKISADGVVSTLAGSGAAGSTNGQGTKATFDMPTGITINTLGELFVADYGSHLIRKVTADGLVSTLAGNTTAGYVNAIGTSARFNQPAGIVADGAGNLYVADAGNRAVRKIGTDGSVTTICGGTGSRTLLGQPQAITIDRNGALLIADAEGRILRLGTDGILQTLAGSAATYGFMDGEGSLAQFFYPSGITSDAAGNIYVADRYNHRLRKIAFDDL